MKFATADHAFRWYNSVFMPAARIVEGDTWYWTETVDDRGNRNYKQAYAGRDWFRRERNRYHLHPAVEDMMLHYRPTDWHQLLLEWPHKSDTDPNRLAYTRDERAGRDDRQLITTIGKYLTRHFQDAPDHLIRDIVAKRTYPGDIKIVRDMQAMVRVVIDGPASCMSKEFNIECADREDRHPYEVYDPSLGWSMAIRSDSNGNIFGRCLLWEGDAEGMTHKCFVRSYKREHGQYSHSGADEAIEMYLKSQGWQKRHSWPDGAQLMKYEARNGGWLMPYIDGGTQRVDESTFCIDSNGDIEADNTGGTADSYDSQCENCGARFDGDHSGLWAGRHEDYHVCDNCAEDYTYVYGRRRNQYYMHNDDIIEVNGEYYDPEYLGDNNIVELANGDYEDMDNAVYIESEGAYYHCDDEDICYAEDTNQYELKHDCWQCEATGNWYTNDEDYVEVDGCTYHPDDAPEAEEANEEADEEEAEAVAEAKPAPIEPHALTQPTATNPDEPFILAA